MVNHKRIGGLAGRNIQEALSGKQQGWLDPGHMS